jgi:two-component system chemotaxis sensor kinase CheA
MMTAHGDIVERLESLVAEALALDGTDPPSLVRVGTTLEELLPLVQPVCAPAGSHVERALRGLQIVYQGQSPDPAASMEAIAASLASAREAMSALCQAECAPPAAPAGPGADAPPPPVATVAPAPLEPATPAAAIPKREEGPPSSGVLPPDTDLALLKEFVAECLDHISAAETSLLDLESDPGNAELVNTIFRAFHTIKGTSGFLGLEWIQRLAHLAENLLARARDGQIRIVGGYADLALRSCDVLRAMIEGLPAVEPGGPLPVPPSAADLLQTLAHPDEVGADETGQATALRVGDILVGQGTVDRRTVELVADAKVDSQRIGTALVQTGVVPAQEVAKALRTQRKMDGDGGDSTIRMGTARLDSLIDMVGELVIAQSMVAQDPRAAQAAGLARKVSHAGKIVRELQDLTMSLRMVPLRGLFQKMARLVRDLARKSGKTVRFVTEGEGTEIDRSMVEVLNDPLVHMIRNAVDHGIESPQQRAGAGKEATGTVRLRAFHAAGNVVIELSDDGKGLDRDKILSKAIEKGLVPAGRDMTESEIFGLIFRPGFSTADKITDVSGRGVGMDVVKRGIDSLRGRIDIVSKPGAGATFSLRLPLTMAISDSMLLGVGPQRFLLPTVSIEHSFRPSAGDLSTVTGRGEVVQLRGELLPIFRLHRLFGVPDAVADPTQGLLIVIAGQSRRCALMVDALLGQQQVVIKSLGRELAGIPGVAGAAILGDGRIGLILDAAGLVALAQDSNQETKTAGPATGPDRQAA